MLLIPYTPSRHIQYILPHTVGAEGYFPVLHAHSSKTWHSFFFCYCVKTTGGFMITFIFTVRLLWRLSKIDRTCGGHCCAVQILSSQKDKKNSGNKKQWSHGEKGLCLTLWVSTYPGQGAKPLWCQRVCATHCQNNLPPYLCRHSSVN